MSRSRHSSPTRTAGRLVVAAAVSLVGCGGGTTTPASSTPAGSGGSALAGLSADQVLTKVKTAVAKAASVHLKGHGTSNGKPLDIDLRLVRDRGGAGTFGLNGGTVAIVADGTTVWMKADDAFYKQALGDKYTAAVATLIGGRYLKGPKSDTRLASVAGIVDMQTLLDNTLSPDGKISRVAGKPIGGIATVALKSAGGDGGLLFVADDGTDLPLALEPSGGAGSDTGQLTLSDWGATFELTPPPDDQVIDISKLPTG